MLKEGLLNEAVKKLVDRFHPEKIILFGSQARGTSDEVSDVDLLVISPVPQNRISLLVEMDSAVGGIGIPVDIVVLTSEEYEIERQIVGTIGRYASREGKVLYERPH